MGELGRRAERIEEQLEGRERSRQLESERVFREALGRVSTAELEAMREAFNRPSGDIDEAERSWTEEDLPLMRRLLELVNEVRAEEAGPSLGYPWQREGNLAKREEHHDY
jgi:hypothetical protein